MRARDTESRNEAGEVNAILSNGTKKIKTCQIQNLEDVCDRPLLPHRS